MLEFGDKNHEVSMTALRLVQRMKRDWMHTGRRPSGLCGAEFEDTPTSQLTIDEFMRVDLEQECDPPSFTAGQQKVKMQQVDLPASDWLSNPLKLGHTGRDSVFYSEIVSGAFTYPEVEEVLSSTSDMEEREREREGENADLQAATQHLTQDFLCQVIQEEGVQGKTTPEGVYSQEAAPEKEGTGVHSQVTPLSSILGKLPSTASLGLQETFKTFDKSEPSEEPNDLMQLHVFCFPEKLSQTGELDLEGIDDQEIDK
ncbi:hypothetical protein GOODEAATRI_025230, partial [Goodea atripinnis]